MQKKNGILAHNMLEWSTTGLLSDPVTQEELAKALLSEEESKAFSFTAQTLIVEGHYRLNSTEQALTALLNYVKPEAWLKHSIAIETKNSFHFVTATTKIAKKYGLTTLKVEGTRKKVVSITVSSIADADKPEVHIHKYAEVLRSFKKKYPKIRIIRDEKKGCIATGNCNVLAEKLLTATYNEINPVE